MALLLSVGCWWALFAGVLGSHAGIGLMFGGGWTLSLLPIHSARWAPRPSASRPSAPRPSVPQSSAPQPEPAGGGVETGGLEDRPEL